MTSINLKSPESVVAEFVADGDTVFVGGFGHAVPFALGHELIRAGKQNLTICRSGADILVDQLIAAGCVSKVVFGWIGNPDVGISHSFRRAVASGSLEWEEWTNWSMVLRLRAAAQGVTFLPSRVLLAGDSPRVLPDLRKITCPYTGEEYSAIPALEPDVALIHAQRADREGNVQLWGIIGDTVDGALASRRIVATVEEVVDAEAIRSSPNRTVIPAHRLSAVTLAPWGSHPSYVEDHYTRDDDHFRYYDTISRTESGSQDYLNDWVFDVNRREYLDKVDTARLQVSR